MAARNSIMEQGDCLEAGIKPPRETSWLPPQDLNIASQVTAGLDTEYTPPFTQRHHGHWASYHHCHTDHHGGRPGCECAEATKRCLQRARKDSSSSVVCWREPVERCHAHLFPEKRQGECHGRRLGTRLERIGLLLGFLNVFWLKSDTARARVSGGQCRRPQVLRLSLQVSRRGAAPGAGEQHPG